MLYRCTHTATVGVKGLKVTTEQLSRNHYWTTCVRVGSTGEEEHWSLCVADTESVLSFAVGAMFVRQEFDGNSKRTACTHVAHKNETIHLYSV